VLTFFVPFFAEKKRFAKGKLTKRGSMQTPWIARQWGDVCVGARVSPGVHVDPTPRLRVRGFHEPSGSAFFKDKTVTDGKVCGGAISVKDLLESIASGACTATLNDNTLLIRQGPMELSLTEVVGWTGFDCSRRFEAQHVLNCALKRRVQELEARTWVSPWQAVDSNASRDLSLAHPLKDVPTSVSIQFKPAADSTEVWDVTNNSHSCGHDSHHGSSFRLSDTHVVVSIWEGGFAGRHRSGCSVYTKGFCRVVLRKE
jgi:hypothetical protein